MGGASKVGLGDAHARRHWPAASGPWPAAWAATWAMATGEWPTCRWPRVGRWATVAADRGIAAVSATPVSQFLSEVGTQKQKLVVALAMECYKGIYAN